MEAPTVGGQQSALADYGEVFSRSARRSSQTIGSGGSDVDGGSADTIAMKDSKGSVVSTGTAVTPSIVQ